MQPSFAPQPAALRPSTTPLAACATPQHRPPRPPRRSRPLRSPRSRAAKQAPTTTRRHRPKVPSPTPRPAAQPASSASPTPSASRHAAPDPVLHARAARAAKLHAARKSLRKTLGAEPPILSAVQLAAVSDGTLSSDMADWHSVFAARNEITVTWLWVVAAVARQAHQTYLHGFPEMRAALSLADLAQEGVCGLMKAVERWDPSRQFAFDAYAFYCVKYAILRAIENQSRPIRLPVHVLNKLSKMRKVHDTLLCAEGEDEPSVEDVARMAGVDLSEAELYLQRSKTMASIDAPLPRRGGDTGHATLREFLVDHSQDAARQVERMCTREAVAELVRTSNLEELEKSVVLLKYGLSDGVERVRGEVSKILNIRVAQVRRAELSALKKLRETACDDLGTWVEFMS